jgi:hypothetical protein
MGDLHYYNDINPKSGRSMITTIIIFDTVLIDEEFGTTTTITGEALGHDPFVVGDECGILVVVVPVDSVMYLLLTSCSSCLLLLLAVSVVTVLVSVLVTVVVIVIVVTEVTLAPVESHSGHDIDEGISGISHRVTYRSSLIRTFLQNIASLFSWMKNVLLLEYTGEAPAFAARTAGGMMMLLRWKRM